jgi:hypothetical protein
MPYEHETRNMEVEAAESLVSRVRAAALENSRARLEQLREELTPNRLAAMAIRTPALPYLPDSVAEVHKSWHATCRADGMLYHIALTTAASELGLAVATLDRGSEERAAAAALGLDLWEMPPLLRQLGREQRSWTAEHRRAAAAALACLKE